ncbi:putative ubiquitin carboxyl-terminal hydrolase 6 [Iris pallida]|uniref:Ubiquitin carboxyl-terminal hydrolase 6 n=1 Tax=Iris pallida TaxID=29817 RepID=A0AAX6FCN9_IRIPA|nr:putative ubiquitin carboxyl-terminal hydrolase 6 [Iris pallida]
MVYEWGVSICLLEPSPGSSSLGLRRKLPKSPSTSPADCNQRRQRLFAFASMTPLRLSRFDSDLWPPPPSSSCSSDFFRSSGRSRHIPSGIAHASPDSFPCHQRLRRRSCRYNQR